MSMESDDRSYLVDCLDCSEPIDPAFDRPFAITAEVMLCHTCALRRGGAYDSDNEIWAVAPSLDAIPEERIPHL